MKLSEHLKCVLQMPERDHWPDRNQDFDMMKSLVMDWVCGQSEVRQWLFDYLRNRGVIRFDIVKKVWVGSGSTWKPVARSSAKILPEHLVALLPKDERCGIPTLKWLAMAQDSLGISSATFYRIKKEAEHTGMSEWKPVGEKAFSNFRTKSSSNPPDSGQNSDPIAALAASTD